MNTDYSVLLDSIPVEGLTYNEWLKVGMALHYEQCPVNVWVEWSAKDNPSRFKKGECESKWKGFHDDEEDPVTGAFIMDLAKKNGYIPRPMADDVIPFDGLIDDELPPAAKNEDERIRNGPSQFLPVDEALRYIKTLFKPGDMISVAMNPYFGVDDEDPNTRPNFHGSMLKYENIIKNLKKGYEKYGNSDIVIRNTFGDYNAGMGAWIRLNPFQPGAETCSDNNVKDFRYALVESDTMSLYQQISMLKKLNLPIKMMVFSGGKSIHAIVKIEADTQQEYRRRVAFLYDYCSSHGFTLDEATKNPSRLTRLPGVKRGELNQYIVSGECGATSWDEWEQNAKNPLPTVVSVRDMIATCKGLNPELIPGFLRMGHKMIITAASKAGKSFLLQETCIEVAEGLSWMCGASTSPCRRGKALYVNCEIDTNSCAMRFQSIYEALEQKYGFKRKYDDNIRVLPLRGYTQPLDHMNKQILRELYKDDYSLLVIDPLYKVLTGDENNATEMARMVNLIDEIIRTYHDKTNHWLATIYAHHHPKGNMGMRSAIDRGSGSGVFSRDADAIIDISESSDVIDGKDADEPIEDGVIDDPEEGKNNVFVISSSLREFPNRDPFKVRFNFPLHEFFDDGKKPIVKGSEDEGRQKGANANRAKREAKIEDVLKVFNELQTDNHAGLSDVAKVLSDEYGAGYSYSTVKRIFKENLKDQFYTQKGVVYRKI